MNNSTIYFHSHFFIEQSEIEKAKTFKKLFPNAIVKKFILVHSGFSSSSIIQGNKKFTKKLFWEKETIQKIFDKLKKGMQVIAGHTIDGILRNEKIVGELIDFNIADNRDKKIIYGIVGFYDKNDSDYNSISMESVVSINNDKVEDIDRIDRFACGNIERGEIPAFPLAVEQSVIHCFFNQEIIDESKEIIDESKKNIDRGKKIMEEISFTQVKEFIRKHNVFPTQIWTVQELVGIPKNDNNEFVFVNGIDDRLNAYITKSLPDFSSFSKKISELEEQVKTLQESKNELERLKKEKIIDEFRKKVIYKAEEKKVSDKLKKFLTKKLEKYDKEVADLEKDSEDFIKQSTEELNELLDSMSELNESKNKIPTESELSEKKPIFDDQF